MKVIKIVWKKWVVVAQKIGNFQARLLLSVFYFTLLLPFSLVVTLFSDRLVKRKPPKTTWTTWTEAYETFEEAKGQQ